MKKFNWGVVVVPAVCITMFLLGAAIVWINAVPALAEPLEYTNPYDSYIQVIASDIDTTKYSPRTGKTWNKWCKADEKQCYWIPMIEWDGKGAPPDAS